MKTAEALTRFLKKCEERELSPNTRRNYYGYLRHFAEEHPDLPTDTLTINLYLKKRKETPAHRGYHFRCLQAFYSYLEEFEGITSPVPKKGDVGRPRKVEKIVSKREELGGTTTLLEEELVRGGSLRLELHIYLHHRSRESVYGHERGRGAQPEDPGRVFWLF